MSHAYASDSYVSIDLGRTVRLRTRAAAANSTALVRRLGLRAAACDGGSRKAWTPGMKFASVSVPLLTSSVERRGPPWWSCDDSVGSTIRRPLGGRKVSSRSELVDRRRQCPRWALATALSNGRFALIIGSNCRHERLLETGWSNGAGL
jgi:hypothetical protein